MGLLDWFRRPRDTAPDPFRDLYARMGGLSVEIETLKGRNEALRDEWLTMRDELRRLAQRLEKRDQRAEQKAAEQLEALETEAEPNGDRAGSPQSRLFDEIEAQRQLRERKRFRGH